MTGFTNRRRFVTLWPAALLDRGQVSRHERDWRSGMLAILAAGVFAMLLVSAAPAAAGNTNFLTEKGTIPFPLSPPNRATPGPGAIDNMTIGAVTPAPGTFSLLVAPGATAPAATTATGAGSNAALTGGAGGSTSGAGGSALVTGGAGSAGNASGGSVVLTGGAKNGSGIAGGVRVESILVRTQAAPTAKTVSATLTAAELLAGIITVTQGSGAASAQQVPTGTAIQSALPADFAVGDSFDVSVINLGGASEVASITVNTDVTIVGNAAVPVPASGVQSSALFRFRKTADHVFVVYRIA